jgi:hypothetical protein
MGLSNELISQFAKLAVADKNQTPTETTVYGTTVVYEGRTYVKLDGSDLLTPVQTTSSTKDGDRVTVLIKNHTATITGNTSDPAASSNTVKDQASQITEFEIVMAHKVTTEELEAFNATIENLKAANANIGNLDAVNAAIENLEAKFADVEHLNANDVTAINAAIENLEAKFAEIGDLTVEELEAINAQINNLKGYTADFTYVSADVLQAFRGNIKELEAQKLSVKDADIKYANIDFSNIGQAAFEYFYANSGLIKDVTIDNGIITGELVGVTIRGDLIEGGTVVADKLVIKGEDGLYYKLNTDGESIETEQTEYNSLDGKHILAKSITATKVSVEDLVAFGATIGGFHITDDSIYSGVKESVGNTTRGIYMDNTGQMAIGDSNNYIKYYKDQNGIYRLEVSAGVITFGGSGGSSEETTDLETVVGDIKKDVDTLRDEITTLLRIESSRGTVFKNDNVSTVLSVVIYHGSERITTSEAMRKTYGNNAYLQWKWQRIDDETFGVILSSDPRFGDNGFTFTLSPDDVDTKVTFMCELIT